MDTVLEYSCSKNGQVAAIPLKINAQDVAYWQKKI